MGDRTIVACGSGDPLIYGAVAGAMVIVSLLAAAVPAMRATRADPNLALRAE